MDHLGDFYQHWRKQLRDVSDTPDLDARLLIAHVVSCAPDDVILKPNIKIDHTDALLNVMNRRLKHEPVAKIIGHKEFYGHDIRVNCDVLDPRPDTETLVDAASKFLRGIDTTHPKILDMCCGTGCVFIALAALFPNASGTIVDISDAALSIAADNIQRHAMDDRVHILKSNYCASVDETFDLIVSNPPYIPSADIESLDRDVKNYDPSLALDGGANGLCAYEILFPQIRMRLKPGGIALFEFGAGQEKDIERLAQNCGLEVVEWFKDLGGHVRVVALR